MSTREIARMNWPQFFDSVSAALRGKVIGIEISSLELGAQTEARDLSLDGLTYDAKDDALIISTEVIEHVIRAPRRIFVADGDAGIDSLEVVADDGSNQLVNFSEPLALPPGQGLRREP